MLARVGILGLAFLAGGFGGGKLYDRYRPPFCQTIDCTTAELAKDKHRRFLIQIAGGLAGLLAVRAARDLLR